MRPCGRPWKRWMELPSMTLYQEHNANLADLITNDREIDMVERDKAWTAANPEA